MTTYLRPAMSVPLDRLYPDPNNPRLALHDAPGYEDVDALFDEQRRREIFETIGKGAYEVEDLVGAVTGQGWLPIDNIIVWQPAGEDRYVVVEGNRRRVVLDLIRSEELPKASKKLDRMRAKPTQFSTAQIEAQTELVERLERIVAETDQLQVMPLDADTIAELEHKLPRVLAVRHITGAKEWGNYAEDLWLLNRYYHLFEDKHGSEVGLFWDASLVHNVADEASLSVTKTKRQLRAASWFSHFKAEWEDELPEGEAFSPTDYFLFELLSRLPWVRQQFGIGEDDFAIPEEGEKVLFQWVFSQPRGRTADDNDNIFYRHENLRLWNQIKKYDDQQGTSFAARFDVSNPDDAPTMAEAQADYLSHKARRKPHAVLDELLRRLGELTAETLATEGRNLRVQLTHVRDECDTFLKMIDAAD